MRALERAEALVPREERRIERELLLHRAAAGAIVRDVADRVTHTPPAAELLALASALEAASAAQRTASGALLALARVRLERARAAVAGDEDAGDVVPNLH